MLTAFSFVIKFVRQLQKGEVNAIKHQKNYFLVSGFDDWFDIQNLWENRSTGKNKLVCENAVAWVMQATGDSTNSFPTWHQRNWKKGKWQVNSMEFLHSFLRSYFFRETIGELWNVGWFLRLYVLYNSQLVLEWLRSLLLLYCTSLKFFIPLILLCHFNMVFELVS